MNGLGVTLLLAAAVSARAQSAATLFAKQAEVYADRPGIVRLPLPPEVLEQSRPDLGDLRLYDRAGREIPYVVDSGAVVLVRKEAVPLRVTNVSRSQSDADAMPTRYLERLSVDAPEAGEWTLSIATKLPEVVRQLTLVEIDGTRETTLLDKVSLFRVPRMQAERLDFTVRAGGGRRWVLTFEGREDHYVEPVLTVTRTNSFGGGRELEVPLRVETSSQDGKTVLRVNRPRGLVPTALRIETSTPLFERRVRVRDGGKLLGSARLFRLESDLTLEQLTVPVGVASSDALTVEIDDEDSSALDALRVVALVRQPSLVFSAELAGEGRAALLRFGGKRARPPRYDVSALLSFHHSTPGLAERLFDEAKLGRARIGPIGANPEFDAEPALGFALHPGAEVDVRRYTHMATIEVAPTIDGLTQLELDAQTLALLRPDLADLRIVDSARRQWPYLLDASDPKRSAELVVQQEATEKKTTSYTLYQPGVSALRVTALVLETKAQLVNRRFRLFAVDKDGKRPLADGVLSKRADAAEAAISIALPGLTRVGRFELQVDDGDDAPLALTAKAECVGATVYLTSPHGRFFALLGDANAEPPRYELQSAASVVLAVDAEQAQLEGLRDNPDYSVAAKLDGSEATTSIALWGAIALAVLVLGGLTLRMASKQDV